MDRIFLSPISRATKRPGGGARGASAAGTISATLPMRSALVRPCRVTSIPALRSQASVKLRTCSSIDGTRIFAGRTLTRSPPTISTRQRSVLLVKSSSVPRHPLSSVRLERFRSCTRSPEHSFFSSCGPEHSSLLSCVMISFAMVRLESIGVARTGAQHARKIILRRHSVLGRGVGAIMVVQCSAPVLFYYLLPSVHGRGKYELSCTGVVTDLL